MWAMPTIRVLDGGNDYVGVRVCVFKYVFSPKLADFRFCALRRMNSERIPLLMSGMAIGWPAWLIVEQIQLIEEMHGVLSSSSSSAS